MDDAEFFLPSEIARLVYGQFRAMECDDLSTKFLNESSHLSECRELKKRNRTFKTEANGLSLKEILDQYLSMNKLRTVNKLVGNHPKFSDPVEAFNYLLGNAPKKDQTCTNVGNENQDSTESCSSSSSEDTFSDFSLNLQTPDKHKLREKVTKKTLETVFERNNTIDRTAQETTPETNKLASGPTSDTLIRQSTRLQLKKTLKNDRSCNSDSIKELRLNPNDDCKTPRKVGNPPYSENKLLKPKTPISLLSSDSEPETSRDAELSVLTTPSCSMLITERLNGLFSPERPSKAHSIKKKTLKVMRPRRPPSMTAISDDQSSNNNKIKCKRNRVSTLRSLKNNESENKKSKLSSGTSQLQRDTINEKDRRSSDEFVRAANETQSGDKQKIRRKSGSLIPVNDDGLNSIKLNKSLPIIDDAVFGKKLIDNVKLQERIVANINEVIINSPQKKSNETDTVDLDELINKSIAKIVDDPLYKEFECDVMDFISGQTNSDINSVTEFTGNETAAASIADITDQPQLYSQITAEMEDPLVNNTGNVESHPEKENPAIIIEIRDNQIVNQENYVEKPVAVSDEFRNYFSNMTGLESSPDGKLNSTKSDHTSVINSITPDGEIPESCRIGNGTSDRMVLNSDAVLFPINEGIPMSIIAKGSEFQICGSPSSISQVNRKKHQYVPIAPKPNIAIQTADPTIERGKVPRKRRTRGGKRS